MSDMSVHHSSNSVEWETPQDLFDALNTLHEFDLDVCATDDNAKCEFYYTKEIDGLSQAWSGSCWCNPPYGRAIAKWVKKAYESARDGTAKVVLLVPARTDTKWFHNYALKGEIHFIKGRLKFSGAKYSAPFPSMIVVFDRPSLLD